MSNNNELEKKYSKNSFFRFLISKNLDNLYFLGFFVFLFFICGLLFAGKILDYTWGQIFSSLIILICLILVTKNLFVSVFEFFKKDSYNSFLVSNFIYKTKLIRIFCVDKALSLEAKLGFIKAKNPEIDIEQEIKFLSLSKTVEGLKMEANSMYTKEYFIERENYELLFPSFRKLFNSKYIFKSIYEEYFWNTKSKFNEESLSDEVNLENFNKLTETLLSKTKEQQLFLLEKLKAKKILPENFIMLS